METRGNELELLPPLLLDVELVGCTAFIVNDFEVDVMAALGEAGHDLICGGNAVAVVVGLKIIHQDYIGVHMTGEHNEVVAALGANREPFHVISVNLDDGLRCDVELLWC